MFRLQTTDIKVAVRELTCGNNNDHYHHPPIQKNPNHVKTDASTYPGPFLSNSSCFCGKKNLLFIFSKPIINIFCIVMLNSLDDSLGFQPPPPI